MQVRLVDNEPRWCNFIKGFLDTSENSGIIFLSSRLMNDKKELFSQGKVFVFTGKPTTQEAILAYRLGAYRYLPKNFDKKVILKELELCQ